MSFSISVIVIVYKNSVAVSFGCQLKNMTDTMGRGHGLKSQKSWYDAMSSIPICFLKCSFCVAKLRYCQSYFIA